MPHQTSCNRTNCDIQVMQRELPTFNKVFIDNILHVTIIRVRRNPGLDDRAAFLDLVEEPLPQDNKVGILKENIVESTKQIFFSHN